MTAFILRARRFLRRIDPNDDPHAEPLSVPALLTVLVLTGPLRALHRHLPERHCHWSPSTLFQDELARITAMPGLAVPFDDDLRFRYCPPEERNGGGRACRQPVELEDGGIVGQNLSFLARYAHTRAERVWSPETWR